MKYLITFYIALGLVLSSIITIEYNCSGNEMFPRFWGSPFVFTKESLASSMEFYYGLLPLFFNTLIWSLVLLILNFLYQKAVFNIKHFKSIKILQNVILLIFILFSTLNIMFSFETAGRNFGKGFNYWTLDMEKDAKIWEMECEGEIKIIKLL